MREQRPQTVQLSWRWDELWRDSWFKQVSGFTLLGLSAVGLLLVSARKRIRRHNPGPDFVGDQNHRS